MLICRYSSITNKKGFKMYKDVKMEGVVYSIEIDDFEIGAYSRIEGYYYNEHIIAN